MVICHFISAKAQRLYNTVNRNVNNGIICLNVGSSNVTNIPQDDGTQNMGHMVWRQGGCVESLHTYQVFCKSKTALKKVVYQEKKRWRQMHYYSSLMTDDRNRPSSIQLTLTYFNKPLWFHEAWTWDLEEKRNFHWMKAQPGILWGVHWFPFLLSVVSGTLTWRSVLECRDKCYFYSV